MATTVQAQMSLRLPYTIQEEEGWKVASCEVLDVHSQGKTEQEAVEHLREALQLFLETCLEIGTLDDVLKAQGFRLAAGEPCTASGLTGC